jgi:hypothetical protein
MTQESSKVLRDAPIETPFCVLMRKYQIEKYILGEHPLDYIGQECVYLQQLRASFNSRTVWMESQVIATFPN